MMADDFTQNRTVAAQALMQQLFAPSSSPIPGVEYAVTYRFGEHGGGDVADVFDCGSDGVFISLADIEGSGQDAAVHAAMVKYGIRAYACAHRRPSHVLQNLNALYMRNCKCEGRESFATLFLALVDASRDTMTYVSAGYEAALLVHPNGFSEILPASGPIVGVLDGCDARFVERRVRMQAGATLVAVSDGITEARLGNRRFGLTRVRTLLAGRAAAPLDHLVREILECAAGFCRGNIPDDMAVLAVRFGVEGVSSKYATNSAKP